MSEYDQMSPKIIPNYDDPDPAVKIQAHITSVTLLNSDTIELTLVLEQPLAHNSDQSSLFFVRYHPTLTNEQGSYSFARGNSPGTVNTVQFHIRKVPGGTFNKWLFGGNKTGEQVILEGPFGSFTRISVRTPAERGRKAVGELGLCVQPSPLSDSK